MVAAITTEPRAPSDRDLERAEDDLEWWYAQRHAALGDHSAGTEPGLQAPWDDARVWGIFDRLFHFRHTRAVRRYYRVAPIVARLSPRAHTLADALYTPRAYTPLLRDQIFPCHRKGSGLLTLAGAALLTESLAGAFARAHGGKPHGSPVELLEWCDKAVRPNVEHGRVTNQRAPDWVKRVLAEARELRAEALAAYAAVARDLAEMQREAKRLEIARLRAGEGP